MTRRPARPDTDDFLDRAERDTQSNVAQNDASSRILAEGEKNEGVRQEDKYSPDFTKDVPVHIQMKGLHFLLISPVCSRKSELLRTD